MKYHCSVCVLTVWAWMILWHNLSGSAKYSYATSPSFLTKKKGKHLNTILLLLPFLTKLLHKMLQQPWLSYLSVIASRFNSDHLRLCELQGTEEQSRVWYCSREDLQIHTFDLFCSFWTQAKFRLRFGWIISEKK